MLASILAISAGASAGAVLRWLLGMSLNAMFPAIPPGTLAANLIGGYLIGVAMAVFADHPGLSPEWRLLVMTGLCGGFTTFSAFSLQSFRMIENGQWGLAASYAAVSVIASIAAVALGFALVRA